MSVIKQELKEIFRAAAARRKANGIRLRKWSIMIEENVENSIEELWEEWVLLLGSDKAALFLQDCMMRYTEILRECKREQDERLMSHFPKSGSR